MTTPPDSSPTDPSGTSPQPENALPPWARRSNGNGELSDEVLASLIGPRWETYRQKLAVFRADPHFVPTWNWSAALVPPFWFLYRKLYLPFAVSLLIPNLLAYALTGSDVQMTASAMEDPEVQRLMVTRLGIQVSLSLAAGGTANWLLFRRARAAAKLVRMQQLPAAESATLLQRFGGVNKTGPWFLLALQVVGNLMMLRA